MTILSYEAKNFEIISRDLHRFLSIETEVVEALKAARHCIFSTSVETGFHVSTIHLHCRNMNGDDTIPEVLLSLRCSLVQNAQDRLVWLLYHYDYTTEKRSEKFRCDIS